LLVLDRFDVLSLLLEVLVTVDLYRQLILQKVVNEEFGGAVNVMLSFVVEHRCVMPALTDWSSVSCFIHIEFVFAINIAAEVFRQARNVADLNFEIERLA